MFVDPPMWLAKMPNSHHLLPLPFTIRWDMLLGNLLTLSLDIIKHLHTYINIISDRGQERE